MLWERELHCEIKKSKSSGCWKRFSLLIAAYLKKGGFPCFINNAKLFTFWKKSYNLKMLLTAGNKIESHCSLLRASNQAVWDFLEGYFLFKIHIRQWKVQLWLNKPVCVTNCKKKKHMQASISHTEVPWEIEIPILTCTFSLP